MKKNLLAISIVSTFMPLSLVLSCGNDYKRINSFDIKQETTEKEFNAFLIKHKGEKIQFIYDQKAVIYQISQKGTLAKTLNEIKAEIGIKLKLWHYWEQKPGEDKMFQKKIGYANSWNRILSDKFYNHLLEMPSFNKKEDVMFSIIANQKAYTEIIPILNKNETALDTLKRAISFDIYTYDSGPALGFWMEGFRLKQDDGKWSDWMHGESNMKNNVYPDEGNKSYSPLWFVNHTFSSYGISNYHVAPGEIYEISYDNNAS